MSRPLVFRPEVRDEIDVAYLWYERRRDGLGEAFLAELQAAFDRIEQDPERSAPILLDVRRTRLNRFPYAVYYRPEQDRVAVIAVHHAKQDPKRWRSRV